jgi:hypothetical protein
MSIKKPTPVIDACALRTCPVCGKRSYSSNGIHPQCAMKHADESRTRRYKTDKKAVPKTISKLAKPSLLSWKKQCPKCGVDLHISSKACTCGHHFVR